MTLRIIYGISKGTFTDYFSMKENDNIYFFIKRKIYRVGKIVTINIDCKYLNYINADYPSIPTLKEYEEGEPPLPYGSRNNRCFCTFIPTPYFFKNWVDMDDSLNSNPSKFRMLRALWKFSFVKIDDEENQALLDIILKRNEEDIQIGHNVFLFNSKLYSYKLNSSQILESCVSGNLIRHEMAIEAI